MAAAHIPTEVAKDNVMWFQTPSAWRGRWQLVNSFVSLAVTVLTSVVMGLGTFLLIQLDEMINRRENIR
jgi:hypothetical protein